MNRRMSHALPIRSTLMPVRVTQVAPCTRVAAAGGGRGRRPPGVGQRVLGAGAPRGAEEVDPPRLLQPAPEPRQLLLRGVAARRQRACVPLDRRVFRVPLGPEHGLDLLVGGARQHRPAAEGGLAALRPDLANQPLEVLPGVLPARQQVDRVLERHGAHPLQPAADLDPEIVGLGRDLVDEQEPRAPALARAPCADITDEAFISHNCIISWAAPQGGGMDRQYDTLYAYLALARRPGSAGGGEEVDDRIRLLVRQLAADRSGCRWCIDRARHDWRAPGSAGGSSGTAWPS